ncbi:uncharacterized protein LOC128041066 [Gossypium raimondii]|uniref:uncharacterized protein LOC128041066 n=1 Tax=Gossypium raimondii TaxID=29730 RepID=UPI00227C6498|nr:uncharacterized protein LOC128041066 [Gossypium raimondii]
MESGGNDGFGGDEIALLTKELIQLSVKSSMVEPSGNFSLICSIWTKKPYNQDSFKAQMRSIWKTRKKFVIQVIGQNLFLIEFELEEDLETVLESQPWLFRKQLILFDRLNKSMLRDQIRLVSSPFWIKIGPCLPEFDKKDLLHAIGVTFGRVIRSEILGEFCRLRVLLNVQRPLRRGIFVSIGNGNKSWIPFKYEKLPTFSFGCGRLGHGIHDCSKFTPAEKNKIKEDPPFSLALKAESTLVGRESLKFNALLKKLQSQCSYVGGITKDQEEYLYMEQSSGLMRGIQDSTWLASTVADLELRKEAGINEGDTVNSNVNNLILARKASWKRRKIIGRMENHEVDRKLQKGKLVELVQDEYGVKEIREENPKRARHDEHDLITEDETNLQMEYSNQTGSVAANGQADRAQ